MDNTYQQLLARYGINPSTGPTPTLFNNGNVNPIYSFLNQHWNQYWPKQAAVSAPQATANTTPNVPIGMFGMPWNILLQRQQQQQRNFSPFSFLNKNSAEPTSQVPDILRFMKN
jgi:hypothetical protein